MSTKVIVTDRSRLLSKYGAAGVGTIEAKLEQLIASDQARGVATRLVAMDRQRDVDAVGAPRIANALDARETKACIDGIYAGLQPDYLVILGAPDVVCHQDLANPVLADEDQAVPSDLPYACDGGFGTETSQFLAPTRVVGRLPDVTGVTDVTPMLDVLKTAIEWQPRNVNAYKKYCAISTAAWQGATSGTLQLVFATGNLDHVAPPTGQPWSKTKLQPRLHLVNCHGADFDMLFYGDDDMGNKPPAIGASDYDGRLRDGAVFAVQCCYGASLYDANALPEVQAGVCNTVMRNGAYAFLGSSNVAYGGAFTSFYADFLCAYFLEGVRKGASAGRAFLEARQRYIEDQEPLDPVDLKTLSQFMLVGDPSVHPVSSSPRRDPSRRLTTSERRQGLARNAASIVARAGSVSTKSDDQVSCPDYVLAGLDLRRYRVLEKGLSFTVHPAKEAATAGRSPAGRHRYLLFALVERERAETRARRGQRGPLGPDALAVAREEDGNSRSVVLAHRR